MRKVIYLCLCLGFWQIALSQSVSVGQFQSMLARMPIVSVFDDGNRIYAASESDLFYLDFRDQSRGSITKEKGLSDIGISVAAFHKPSGKILVGYADGNIDIIKGSRVFNIDDIKRKEMAGDKRIHAIFFKGNEAFLSCGFGIVRFDMGRNEIKETYLIGKNSAELPIYEIYVDDYEIYAATQKGLLSAPVNANNLNDYKVWKREMNLGASAAQKKIGGIVKQGEDLLVIVNGEMGEKDSLYRGRMGQNWSPWHADSYRKINRIQCENKELFVIGKRDTNYWQVDVFNEDFESDFSCKLEYGDVNRMTPGAAMISRKLLWVGQGDGYLMVYDPANESRDFFGQTGPMSNYCYSMSHSGKDLLVCPGGISYSFAPEYRRFDVSILKQNDWTYYSSALDPLLEKCFDPMAALQNPLDPSQIFVSSAVSGLLEFRNGNLYKHYTSQNSSLRDFSDQCRVYSIAYDERGDLWGVNSAENINYVFSINKQGLWNTHRVGSNCTEAVTEIMTDYFNQKWLIMRGGALYVFKEGLANGTLRVDINQGNELSASTVYDVLEDVDGHVWIATERGVRVIYEHAKMFETPNGTTSSVECKTIPYVYDDKVTELLKNEMITCIALDGANQKWLGTHSGGVYLVSADGSKEMLHFTTDNSPLFSNRILSLVVNKENGIVYIGTEKGLMAYRGVATTASEDKKTKPFIFPNPVRPDYRGEIAIQNLPNNADVKITDLSGSLVYQTTAQGGQAVWNGLDRYGRRPQSGVYLVFVYASDDNGTQKGVGKIYFIQ